MLIVILICVLLMLLDDILDLILSLWDQKVNVIILSPFGQVQNLPLERVDGQSLSCGNFKDSLDMNDNLVEIWIIFFELLECLLFVDLKNLLFDSQSLPLVFRALLDHVVIDHVLQRRLGLQSPNLSQSSDAHVLKSVFKPPSFLLLF